MDDFARACGVSRPTLAKFFDDPASVRPSTRARIEAVLAASDYQPNLFARNLNRKRTRNIGLLVPTSTDPFYAEMVSRIELSCRDAGYWPIALSAHGSLDLEQEALKTLQALKVAGAIVAPLGAASDAGLFRRIARQVPLVYFDTFLEGDVPFVGTDNRQSVATIVDYLCRSGEPPIYVDIPHVNHNSGERLAAYEAAMTALGHRPSVLVTAATYTWDFERAGFDFMHRHVEAGLPGGRTLLCANDRVAFGVMAAACARGLTVGRRAGADLRVAGHDDHPLSRYTCPALTTMAQDFAAMASRAVETLLAILDAADADADTSAAPPAAIRLPGTLMMRESA